MSSCRVAEKVNDRIQGKLITFINFPRRSHPKRSKDN